MTGIGTAGASRLRFVFVDSVVSFDVPGTPTGGQIAAKLRQLSDLHHGNPIGISVTLGEPMSRDRSTGRGGLAATWRRIRRTAMLRQYADVSSDQPH